MAIAAPLLPDPRGPVSQAIVDRLRGRRSSSVSMPAAEDDPLDGDDSNLALYLCYELHYRGFADVPDELEWDPPLLAARSELERRFEERLFDVVPVVRPVLDIEQQIVEAIENAGGPSLSTYMAENGTAEEMREFAIHRSAYQLKEADPHTWAIPRLFGEAKAALVAIQMDEYGYGDAAAVHATLFADTMKHLGLDPRYGAYLPYLPGSTLATVNLMSHFGLHRRWRGALVGHFTVFEMTSVVPMGRYSRALTRLGLPASARRFYDVHVTADAEHQVVALRRMAAGLARSEPELKASILFGAKAVLHVERTFAERMLESWRAGTTSLLTPVGSTPATTAASAAASA
jgi:hypothetical protein